MQIFIGNKLTTLIEKLKVVYEGDNESMID